MHLKKEREQTKEATRMPPEQKELPIYIDMEARLIQLLSPRGPEGKKATDELVRLNCIERMATGDRVRILLYVATGIAAVLSGRISRERIKALTADELAGTLDALPEGQMINRHRKLLASLVYKRCQQREKAREEHKARVRAITAAAKAEGRDLNEAAGRALLGTIGEDITDRVTFQRTEDGQAIVFLDGVERGPVAWN